MIIFPEVIYKNFLSSGNVETTINLNPQHPLTLIKGENGSGKSTVLDVLCWGLFGKAFRKINKTDVVNSINGKDCVVKVPFIVKGERYQVTRGVKPNIYHFEGPNGPITDKTPEQILGFDYKTFCNICILGSASYVPFLQLEAKDRRALIEDLLDIKVFSEMNKLLRDEISDSNDKLRINSQQKTAATIALDFLKKQASTVANDNSSKVAEVKATLTKLRMEEETLNASLEHISVPADSLNKVQQKANDILVLEGKISARRAEQAKLHRFFLSHVSCPTCMQEIDNESRTSQMLKIEKQMTELDDGLTKLRVKKAETNTEWTEMQATLAARNTVQVNLSKVRALITDYQKRLLEVQDTVVPDDLLTDIDDAETKLRNLHNEEMGLNLENGYLLFAHKILKDDGVKATIIKKYLPFINQYMNEYLKTMDFFVNIEFDEEFNETIKARHRDEFSYEHFSEGERMRIDLALLLTWRKISGLKSRMDTNLLILDEVFDSSMDESGIDGFMKLLSGPEWKDRNVFVISHKGDAMTDKFDNVITFEKQTFSRII
jgi:DNA repair exonuclease SbcCD ATPase subunit